MDLPVRDFLVPPLGLSRAPRKATYKGVVEYPLNFLPLASIPLEVLSLILANVLEASALVSFAVHTLAGKFKFTLLGMISASWLV